MTVTVREARPSDAAGIARVHVESWRSTYRGIVPDDVIESMSHERRLRAWRRMLAAEDSSQIVLVAEDEEGIVAFVSGGPEREADQDFAGELYAIYSLHDRQRKGIGRRLVRALAERLTARGVTSMLVWVLARNPACRFYEALGGVRVRRRQIEMGGRELEEIGYGWKDVRTIAR